MMNIVDARRLCALNDALVKRMILTKEEVVKLALVYNEALERLEKEIKEGK